MLFDLTASIGLAYENELGRVANGKNKARVAGTTADWFNIRGEKEDRKGNVKVDLNVGVDNQRFYCLSTLSLTNRKLVSRPK